jgi:hypothetical protein
LTPSLLEHPSSTVTWRKCTKAKRIFAKEARLIKGAKGAAVPITLWLTTVDPARRSPGLVDLDQMR